MEVGTVVCSAAGRDRGRFMVIVGFDGDFPLVCDGKERPIKRPKRKARKHLKITDKKLTKEQFISDRSLRKNLKKISDGLMEGNF